MLLFSGSFSFRSSSAVFFTFPRKIQGIGSRDDCCCCCCCRRRRRRRRFAEHHAIIAWLYPTHTQIHQCLATSHVSLQCLQMMRIPLPCLWRIFSMSGSKLRVVYTECDADADVRQLIRSSAGQLPPHDSIDHVVLLKSRSIFTNILKVPFCVLHLVAIALAFREWMALPSQPSFSMFNDSNVSVPEPLGNQTAIQQPQQHVYTLVIVALLIIAHVLLFLTTSWSSRFLRLVCFTAVTSSSDMQNCDSIDATHVYVQPLPSHGKAQVCQRPS